MADLDIEASKTWVYPTNYPEREYQYNIVKSSLLKNTLVCLPTGLGKTFIGAVLIYNYYRWYPSGKIVFLAPTRPLVAQQIEACFNVMGIPQDHTTEMTGTITPENRRLLWQEKHIFFLTPQVLLNDLSRNACPVRIIKLIVIDEAHKALGNHAVCQVMKQLQQQCYKFRVMALSATPGSDVSSIQQVIANLMISHIEIRNEDSPDIEKYTHLRSIETVVIPIEGELKRIKDNYMEVVKFYMSKLINHNVIYSKDEASMCKFQLLKARERFRQNPPTNCDRKTIGMLEGTFALCITLYHAYELLMMYGILSFYNFLKNSLIDEKKMMHYAKQELNKNHHFMQLLDSLKSSYEKPFSEKSTSSSSNSVQRANILSSSHPKMEKLKEILLNHFNFYNSSNRSTRVMVFSQYRESVLEITLMLKNFEPQIIPMSFLGQANKSGKHVSQKEQMQVVREFRSGNYNTLVSTCVGEEGLDIGEVDLIVCYDAPKSPIRLVQRMGRTGRQRDGRIVVLVTKGKEEQSYKQSQYRKKFLVKALTEGNRLSKYLYQNCPRMIPDGIEPTCLKLKMQVGDYKRNEKKKSKGVKRKESLGSYLDSFLDSKESEKEQDIILTKEEMKVYLESCKVSPGLIPKLPKSSFREIDEKIKGLKYIGVDGFSETKFSVIDKTVNLSEYQPWYNTLQSCFSISHSVSTRNLIHLTKFIDLQQIIGDNDNYDIEMAPFFDEKYFQVNDSSLVKKSDGNNAFQVVTKTAKNWKARNNNNNKDIKSYLINMSDTISKDYIDKINEDTIKENEFDDDFVKTEAVLQEREISELKPLETSGEIVLLSQCRKEIKEILQEEQTFCKSDLCLENAFHLINSTQKNLNFTFRSPPVFRSNINVKYVSPHYTNFVLDQLETNLQYLRVEEFNNFFGYLNLLDVNIDSNDFSVIGSSPLIVDSFKDIKESSSEKVAKKDEYGKLNKSESDTDGKCNIEEIEFQKEIVNGHLLLDDVKDSLKNKFLTPPKEHQESKLIDKSPDSSPFFVSKRPPWATNSASICSSTPNDDKSLRLFGNSSISVTPISAGFIGSKLSHIVSNRKFYEGNLVEKQRELDSNSISLINNKLEITSVSRKEKDSSSSEVNFDLNIDDDDALLADVDMEDALKKAEKKYSSHKEKSSNDSIENALCYSINDHCVDKKDSSKLDNPSLLTVTQAIDIINEPSTLRGNPNSSPLIISKKSKAHTLSKYSSDIFQNHQTKGIKTLVKSQSQILTQPHSKIVKNLSSEFSRQDNHFPKVKKSFENMPDPSSVERPITLPNFFPSNINKTTVNNKETLVQFQIGLNELELENNMLDALQTSPNRKKPDFLQKLDESDDLFMDTEELPDAKTSKNTQEENVNLEMKAKSSPKETLNTLNSESNLSLKTKVYSDNPPFCEKVNKESCAATKYLAEKKGSILSDKSTPNFIFNNKVTVDKLKYNSFGKDEISTSLEKQDVLISSKKENVVNNGKPTNISPHWFKLNFFEKTKQDNIGNDSIYDGSSKDKILAENEDINIAECDESMIFRGRKKSNPLIDELESDESLLIQKDKGTRNTSKSNESLKKNRKDSSKLEYMSDDDFDVSHPIMGQMEPVKKKIKETKFKNPKRIIPGFIENEAVVDLNSTAALEQLSSDEPESSLDAYDSSFVDDEVPSTQQQQQEEKVDMKAIYLKSVKSPANKGVFKIPQMEKVIKEGTKVLNDPLEMSFEENDDTLDDEDSSFVVGNNVVEYDTCYMGETMLAEDPIINEAILRANKKSFQRKTIKRKRILHCSSSSDEELFSPLKNSTKEMISSVPLFDCKKIHADEELRKDSIGTSFSGISKNNEKVIGSTLSSKHWESNTPSDEIGLNFSIMLDDDDCLLSGNILEETPKLKGLESPTLETKPKSMKVSNLSANRSSFGAHSVNLDDKNENEFLKKPNIPSSPDDDAFIPPCKKSSTNEKSINSTLANNAATSIIANSIVISTSDMSFNSKMSSKEATVFVAGKTKTAVVTPFNFSFSSSQTITNNSKSLTSQCILVDTTEVSIAGNITSSLRSEHGAQTHILQIAPASYVISSRMAVFRQYISAFANSSNRSRLIERFRELLSKYGRLVVILEKEYRAGLVISTRNYYLDSITCACAQLPQLKVFYSCDQKETIDIIRVLSSREKLKGYSIPLLPSNSASFEQVVKFYRSVPSVSAVSAVFLALNFTSVDVAVKSDVKSLMEKGRLTSQSAMSFKCHFERTFRKDLLKSSLKQNDL